MACKIMNNLKSYLLAQPRNIKRLIFLIHDIFIILIVFWISVALRFSLNQEIVKIENWGVLTLTVLLSIVFFTKLGLYRAILRYMGNKVIGITFVGSVISTLILTSAAYFFHTNLSRTVPIFYFLFLLLVLIGSRIIVSAWLQGFWHRSGVPVIIYGAGSSGRQLQEAIKQLEEYYPVAFIDDDEQLHQSVIQNVTVYSPDNMSTLITRYGVKKILLAIPSASVEQRRTIIQRMEHFHCEVLTIPGMKDLVDGKLTVSTLKKVSVLELLGRTPVSPITELMKANIVDKVVMVTGAGGSIGSELCRQIIQNQPSKLILFELSEFALYRIEKELREYINQHQISIDLIPLLGSVQNQNRLQTIMECYRVQTIYHAAAYKHVPLVEFNIVEGVRNNIFGTLYCAQAAIAAKVENFVLISTDKAVRPSNVMGATKRMAELVLQAMSRISRQKVRFCMVRFGNVLGSSGSVVPVFEKQIAQGGPITLTHPEITRYFMTIPEAAQLVIQAGAMGKGGDVFVLDMGESVKILHLAQQMIRLSGLTVRDDDNPDGDIEIKITGLRPGEKLYEELLVGDNVSGTSHSRIMTATEKYLEWPELESVLQNLDSACSCSDYENIIHILHTAPTDYTPSDKIVDLIWQAKNSL